MAQKRDEMGKHRRSTESSAENQKIVTGTEQELERKVTEEENNNGGKNETNRNKNTQELTFQVKLRVTERAAQTRICRKQ